MPLCGAEGRVSPHALKCGITSPPSDLLVAEDRAAKGMHIILHPAAGYKWARPENAVQRKQLSSRS